MTPNRAVVPIRAGQQIAEPKPKISKAVATGLTDLTIAFRPGRQQNDEDRARWLQICAKVLSRFDQRLIAEVLEWLLTNNEEDPFCPTPQNIVTACKERENEWYAATISKFGLFRSPQAHSCSVPPDVEPTLIRQHLEREIPMILRGNRYVADDHPLVRMPDSLFGGLPRTAFPDGTYEQITSLRQKHRGAIRERHEPQAAQEHLSNVRRSAFSGAPAEQERETDA